MLESASCSYSSSRNQFDWICVEVWLFKSVLELVCYAVLYGHMHVRCARPKEDHGCLSLALSVYSFEASSELALLAFSRGGSKPPRPSQLFVSFPTGQQVKSVHLHACLVCYLGAWAPNSLSSWCTSAVLLSLFFSSFFVMSPSPQDLM